MGSPNGDTDVKILATGTIIKSDPENKWVPEWFSCHFSECNFIGRTKAGLNRHLKNHSLERPYACSQCDRKCTSLSHLKEHMKIHSDCKPFWCFLCEYKCRSKANLKTHLITHTVERPHSCHLCDFKSKTFVNLKNHLRRHTGEKPFNCSVCAYRCSTQGSLNVHMRTHTGERPYFCTECNYRSATSGALKSHYKVHSRDLPFRCDQCHRSFPGLGQLRVHKNVHTKDMTFRCSICSFRSNVTHKIKQHIATHANDLEPTGNWMEVCSRRGVSSMEELQTNGVAPDRTSPNNDATCESNSPFLGDKSNKINCAEPFSSDSQSPFEPFSYCTHRTSSISQTWLSTEDHPCIFCDAVFTDMECLKGHVFSHLNERRPHNVPEFKLPLTFLDKHFPPNHLHEKYWNETGVPARFDGFFSIFLQGFVNNSSQKD